MRLNKATRAKIVKIIKNTFNQDGSYKYINLEGRPYEKLKSSDITHAFVTKHKITEEQLNNYVDLGDI